MTTHFYISRSALVVTLLLLAISAKAAIVSGDYTYDSVTGLYTYNYTLDNTQGAGTISELSILINDTDADFRLEPLGHTDPTDWEFGTAVSGYIANPPYNMFGTFWSWYFIGPFGAGLPVGETLGGFSFTTEYAPSESTRNTYFVWSGDIYIVEYGNIVTPAVPIVPIPSSVLLFLSGAAMFVRKRVKRG